MCEERAQHRVVIKLSTSKLSVWKISLKNRLKICTNATKALFPLFPQLFAAYQYKWALERWKKLGCSIISHGQSEILKRRGTFHLKIVRANLHVDVTTASIKGSKTIGKKTYFRFYNVDFSWKLLVRGKTFFQAVISLLTKWNGHNLSRFESLTFCGRSFSWNKLTYVGEVSVKRLFL